MALRELGCRCVSFVHSAAIQDRDGTGLVLDTVRRRLPWLELIWADSACNAWHVEAEAVKGPVPRMEVCQPEQAPGQRWGESRCRQAGSSPAELLSSATDGAGARRGHAGDRYLSAGRVRAVPGSARTPPTTKRRRADPKARTLTRSRARARRLPPISSRTAILSPIRIAAAATLGGAFTKYLSEAEDGADTLAWLMRQNWCDGRIGRSACPSRAHAGGPRLSRSAGPEGAVSRLRRLLERLSQRHPPRRRVRPETSDLGLSQRARRCARPGDRAALAAQDIAAWFRRMPWRGEIRRSAPPPNTKTICSSSGRTAPSRLLEAARHLCRGILRPLRRGADGASVGLVRPLCPHRDRELRRAVAGQARAGEPDPRAVDARRPLVELAGEVDFGGAAPVDGNLAEDFFDCAGAGSTAGSATASARTESRRNRPSACS